MRCSSLVGTGKITKGSKPISSPRSKKQIGARGKLNRLIYSKSLVIGHLNLLFHRNWGCGWISKETVCYVAGDMKHENKDASYPFRPTVQFS